MAGIDFDITGDNQNLLNSVRQAEAGVVNAINSIEKSGKQMDSVFDNLGKKVAGAFAFSSLVAFQKKIIDVRGEMESLQKSFQSLAGEHVGKKLYEDIKQFATTTPMMMNDLAKGAQTLLAFNIETEKVMPILRQIGDISMGDAQKFNSLTLAFAQASAAGKLMTQDQKQMVGQGFNPLQYMIKSTGKSLNELNEMMSKGEISVEMMEEAFRAATSEGGKFHGMLLAQSKTLNGAISNMQGAYQDMLNSIGEAEQGVLMTGVDLTTKLLQNYEIIGKVLLQLVATYGSYKAAVIAVSVAEDILNGKYIVKTRLLRAAAVAQELLNNAMLKNPAVLVATAVLSLVSALVIFKNRTDEAAETHERLNEAFGETQAKIESEEKKLDDLFGKLRKSVKGSQEYKDAKKAIIDQYGQYFNGLDYEIEKVGGVENAYRKLTQAVRESLMARGKENAMKEVTDAYNKDYGEYLSKIYNQVLNQAGEENAKNAVRAIRADLKLTGEVAEDTQRAIKRVADGVNYAWFGKLNAAESTFKKSQQEVNVLFGEQEKKIDTNAQKAKNLGEAYKEAQKNFNEADAMVKKMAKKRSAYTDEQWNEWTERLKKRKEDFEKLGGDPDGKKAKSDAKAFNEQASRNAKSIEQQQQYEELLARMEQEAANARATANIEAIKNNGERERAERRAEYERQKRDILQQEADIYKTIYEQRKEAYENANKDKKYANTAEGKLGYGKDKNGKFVMAGTLDTGELKLYKAAYSKMMADLDALNAKHNRSETEYQRERIQAMRDYLKEFGTVQQKRLAIQQEYDDKIAEETDEAQRKILEAQKKKALDAFDIEVLKADIDWTTMFDGIGAALEEEMKETLGKIEKYMQSEAFKTSDAKEKAEWVKMRNELRQKTSGGVGTFDFSIYGKIGEDMKAYQKARLELIEAEKAHTNALNEQKEATEELKKAEERLNEARKAGDEGAAVDAQVAVGEAKRKKQAADAKATTTGQAQQDAETNVAVTQGELVDSTTKAQQALDNFGSAIGQMTSGSLKGFADGLVNLIAAIGGENGSGLSGLGKTGGIIGAILSIIDTLGDNDEGISGFVADLLEKFFNIIDVLIDKITSGDFFRDINTAVGEGIQKILESLFESITDIVSNHLQAWKDAGNGDFSSGFLEGFGVGGFAKKIFGEREEEQSQQELQEEISNRIELATYAINRLTEKLNESYGADAIKKAEEARKQMDKRQADYIKGLDAALNDNYGGGHIDYWHWNENTSDLARQLAGQYGLNFDGSWQSLFNNNPAEEIAKMLDDLRVNNIDAWNTLITQGYNEGTVKKWLEQLADSVKQSTDIDDALAEKLTTTTLDNVINDFKSNLYDLADGEEDVTEKMAQNWQKMVNRMVVDNVVLAKYAKDLEQWYKDLADVQEKYNKGDYKSEDDYKDALEDLKRRQQALFEGAQSDTERLTEEGIIQSIKDIEKAFDNMADTFKSALMDMEGSAADFGRDLKQMMYEALIDTFIMTDEFKKRLKEWGDIANSILGKSKEEMQADINAQISEILSRQNDFRAKNDEESAAQLQEQLDHLNEINDVLSGATTDEEARLAYLKYINGQLEEEYVKRREVAKTYAEMSGWAQEQQIASSPFANLGDDILSSLQDTTDDIEDWMRNIRKAMVNDLIKETVFTQDFKDKVRALQDDYVRVMSDTSLSAEEREAELARITEAIRKLYAGAEEGAQALIETSKELDRVITSPFEDMRSTVLNALTDTEGSIEDFRRNLEQTLAKDLMEKLVLDVPITVNDVEYRDFDRYSDEWNKRYVEKMKALQEAQRSGNQQAIEAAQQALDALIDEMVDVEAMTVKASEEFRKRWKAAQKDTTFTDMESNFVSSLMDMNKSAEDWAQDVGKTMAQAIIEQMVVPTLIKPLLKNLQGVFDNAVKEATTTDEEGNTVFDWEKVLNNPALKKGIAGLQAQYPALKETIQDIMSLAGVKPDFYNSLDSLGDTILDRLMSLDDDVEDIGKQIGATLIKEMLKELVDNKYKPQIDEIHQMWQDILSGKDVEHTWEDVLERIRSLESTIAADDTIPNAKKELEELNRVGFDDLEDSFVSALTDMETSAASFGEKIGQQLMNELLKALVKSKYGDRIKALNEEIADYLAGDSQYSFDFIISDAEQLYTEMTELDEEAIKLAEAIKKIGEGTPFDNLRSTMLSTLMDMNGDINDFAKSINQSLTEAFIDEFVLGDAFDQKLGEWKKQYKKIKSDDTLSEEDRAKALRELQNEIVEAKDGYIQQAREIQDLMAYGEYQDQDATMNMADKATYDQFELYLGIATAQQIAMEQGNAVRQQILATLQGMANITSPNNDAVINQMIAANNQLVMIRESSEAIQKYIKENIVTMNQNLNMIANKL